MRKKPFILLTNDDGIHAKGLISLYHALKPLGKVIAVAPLTEQSAVGHAITVSDPLRVIEIPFDDNIIMYGVKGTPADCVKIAVRALFDQPPDLVISGINHGSNTSLNVLYSGTVSAATEGTILGIPSAAISLASHTWDDFSVAANVGYKVAQMLLVNKIPPATLLNVNVPAVEADKITGIRITRQGISHFKECYEKKVDPRGRTYYWLSGEMLELDGHDPLSDTRALNENAVSITPIEYKLTNESFLEPLTNWDFGIL